MQNNNNGAPFGVIRERQIARPINVNANAGAGGFGGALFGAGFGGAPAGGAAGAGAGAGGFGGVPVGAEAGAGGFGGVPVGAPAGGGAGAGVNNRELTPEGDVYPINGFFTQNQPNTPPRQNANFINIAQPQVAVQPTITNQVHTVNGIDTPPPSPRGNF
jgi:hypothetical protein